MQTALEWLKGQLEAQYPDRTQAILEGLNVQRHTTLRVNTLKSSLDEILRLLREAGVECGEAPFYRDALVLPPASEAALRPLPMYQDGQIYLQSLSSMLPPLALGAKEGEDVLDMCAAPGGKTSEIVQLTNGRAMVTACETDKVRCERLRSNLKRLGCERVSVLCTDARKLDSLMKFDRILLDAPCSGSGTLNLTRGLSAFSEKLVVNSARLQGQLLKKACSMLKRGGTLVYSTCSLLKQENEDQVRAALGDRSMRLLPLSPEQWPQLPLLPNALPGTFTVMPDQRFEGFYMAVLQKVG